MSFMVRGYDPPQPMQFDEAGWAIIPDRPRKSLNTLLIHREPNKRVTVTLSSIHSIDHVNRRLTADKEYAFN